MIVFGAGGKGGWPWHGLWRASSNMIETTPPRAYLGDQPDTGDTYLVQIPGRPEPVTTPAEAALGQTWKNWAIISGSTRVLYGKSIGANDHIYIDPDGKPWRVRLTPVGSRVGGSMSVGAYFWPFGVIGPVVETASISLAPVSVGFALHPDYPAATPGLPRVIDIAKNGAKVLVGMARSTSGFAAIAELTITGRPGAGTAAISIALLWDELGVESWPATYASTYDYQWFGLFVQPIPCPTPEPPPPLPWVIGSQWVNGILYGWSGSFWWRDVKMRGDMLGSEPALQPIEANDGAGVYQSAFRVSTSVQRWRVAVELSGARYGADGAPSLITTTTTDGHAVANSGISVPPEVTLSYETCYDSMPPVGFTGTATSISGVVTQTASGNSDYTVTRAVSYSGNIYFQLSSNAPGTAAFNYSANTSSPDGGVSSSSYTGGSAFTSPPGFTLLPTQIDGIGRRFSNRVYGVTSAKYDHAAGTYDPSVRVYGPAIGVTSSVAGYVAASTPSQRPSYATEHPISGGCARAVTPICYM